MPRPDEKSDRPTLDGIPRTIPGFLGYLFMQIVQKRRWLLIPMWILLAILAILLMLSGNSALLPGIYIAL